MTRVSLLSICSLINKCTRHFLDLTTIFRVPFTLVIILLPRLLPPWLSYTFHLSISPSIVSTNFYFLCLSVRTHPWNNEVLLPSPFGIDSQALIVPCLTLFDSSWSPLLLIYISYLVTLHGFTSPLARCCVLDYLLLQSCLHYSGMIAVLRLESVPCALTLCILSISRSAS